MLLYIAGQTDYSNSTEISFEACETRKCVDVDYSINEGDETLYMTLAMMPYLNNKIGLHPRAAELKINSNLLVILVLSINRYNYLYLNRLLAT